MSDFNSLLSFWGEDSDIAKKASKTGFSSLPKYEKPYVPTLDENENEINFVDFLGKYLIQSNQMLMEQQGFIDLDELWKTSEDENIVGWRNDFFKDCPSPFCKRKAYLMRCRIEEYTQPTDVGIETKYRIWKLVTLDNPGRDGEIRMKLLANLTSFYNKDWGYNPASDDTKKISEKGQVKEVKSDPYAYPFITLWTSEQLMKDSFLPYVAKGLKETDNQLRNIRFFALGGYVKKDPKKDDNGTPIVPADYWYSLNLDDIIVW